ncbi:MAG: hypothetical protein ACRYGK_11665 [Janthinobacterium lividum]
MQMILLALAGALTAAIASLLLQQATFSATVVWAGAGLFCGAGVVPACWLTLRLIQMLTWLLAWSFQAGLLACCAYLLWHYATT